MFKKEVLAVIILSLLFGIGLGTVGEIDASNGTTIQHEVISLDHQVWDDGMGTTIHIYHIDPNELKNFEIDDEVLEGTILFKIRVELADDVPNFVSSNLPYSDIYLTDDFGESYQLINEEVSKLTDNDELYELLNIFDWTMCNQAFRGNEKISYEELVWEGVLIFEPADINTKNLYLQLKYFENCQQNKPIRFNFTI